MRGAATIGALAAMLLLSACGFKPLYAESTSASPALASIDVKTGDGRVAYVLRQALLDEFGARGRTGAARYTLTTTDKYTRRGFGIRVDDVATRFEINVGVNYELVDEETGDLIKSGSVSGQASFDVPDQPFAEVAAEESAKERAATLAAERLSTQLSLFFAGYGRS